MKTFLIRLATSRSARLALYATLAATLCAMPAFVHAQATQPVAAIHQAVDQFVRQQTAGLPGKVTYSIGAVDPRVVLAACPLLDVFVPAGGRLWGQTNLGVRCGGATQWLIYVSVDVRISGSYLVAARALAPGQVLGSADFIAQSGDLTLLPQAVLVNPENAIGKIAVSSIAAGQPLRADQLRAPLAIQQGQTVKLLSGGSGFRVSAEGHALNNAQEGQLAQVRTASGQTVSGVARVGGTVEISF